MNWLYWILEFVGRVAWPLTTLTAMLIFREPIIALVRGLKVVKKGEWEAHFAEGKERAAEIYTSMAAQQRKESAPTDILNVKGDDRPQTVILKTWGIVEARLDDLVSAAGDANKEGPKTVAEKIRFLKDKKVIDENAEGSLLGLMQLRNLAVHTPDDEVSQAKAADYVALADAILYVLSRAKLKLPS